MAARLAASARAVIGDLADAAGVEGPEAPRPVVDAELRTAAVNAATRRVPATLDLPGLRTQAVAATRLAARPRGGGPVGIVRSLIARGTGQAERTADPEGHLRRWRERGSLTRAAAPVRGLVTDTLPALPPGARPGLAALADPTTLTDRFGWPPIVRVPAPQVRSVHRSAAGSRVIGLGQLAATAAVANRRPVADHALGWPVAPCRRRRGRTRPGRHARAHDPHRRGHRGLVPAGEAARLHAGRLGVAWADRIGARIGRGVSEVVRDVVETPLAERDAARLALWTATRP